jgi:hypothetical protein
MKGEGRKKEIRFEKFKLVEFPVFRGVSVEEISLHPGGILHIQSTVSEYCTYRARYQNKLTVSKSGKDDGD